MTLQFNELSAAEHERLALLIEEMGEALQAAGKILRHGYESHNPEEHFGPDNRRKLEDELGHVRHAMIRLCDAGDLSKQNIHDSADRKASSVGKWLHHQP